MSTTANGAIDCNEVVEVVTDYLEQKLADAERERLEVHLGECEACDAYIEQMRQTIAGLRRLAVGEQWNGSREQLMAAFSEWSSAR